MGTLINASFVQALARLPEPDQKAVKLSVYDLILDPSARALQLHRIHKAKGKNLWSGEVGRLRLILHKSGDNTSILYVDRHDDAYEWVQRRRIELHPVTRDLQIVEVRELVEEVRRPAPAASGKSQITDSKIPIFDELTDAELLSVGVPTDWLTTVQEVDATGWQKVSEHLPPDVAEVLEEYYTGNGELRPPQLSATFREVGTAQEFETALADPWPAWGPTQRAAFHYYLMTEFRSARTGHPLDRPSADSYRAYISRLALTLRIKLDETDLSEQGLEEVKGRWRAEASRIGIPSSTVGNCSSALAAYAKFMKHARATDAEAAKLAGLRALVQEGLDDTEQGQFEEADDVEAWMKGLGRGAAWS